MACWRGRTWEESQVHQMIGSTKKLPPCEQELFKLSLSYARAIRENGRYPRKLNSQSACAESTRGNPECSETEGDHSHEYDDDDERVLFKVASKEKCVPQTVNMWRASLSLGFHLSKMKKRKVMYIQPLEQFPNFIHAFKYGQVTGFFEFLKNFAEVFFSGYDVRLLPGIDIHQEKWNITTRTHKVTGQKQLLVKDLYKYLNKRIPRHAYCMLGITWTDLYPSEEWNFVLGEANAQFRSGVFSFGRFEPKLYKDGQTPPPLDALDSNLVWRMIKVLSHESCHMFGMNHCAFFQCLMNESSSLEEAINQPFYLCPVCLRKLQIVCRFDVLERYKGLLTFVEQVMLEHPSTHLEKTVQWLHQCISYLETIV